LRDVFGGFFRAGQMIAIARAGATLRELLRAVAGTGFELSGLVAKLAIGRGVLAHTDKLHPATGDVAMVRRFVLLARGSRLTPWGYVQARMEESKRRRRRRSAAPRW
jgi:hypothetical protein